MQLAKTGQDDASPEKSENFFVFQSKCGCLCDSSHRWQGEEGHSNQSEGAGQQPPCPRLGRLVAVADGGQCDLRETSRVSGEDSHAPCVKEGSLQAQGRSGAEGSQL